MRSSDASRRQRVAAVQVQRRESRRFGNMRLNVLLAIRAAHQSSTGPATEKCFASVLRREYRGVAVVAPPLEHDVGAEPVAGPLQRAKNLARPARPSGPRGAQSGRARGRATTSRRRRRRAPRVLRRPPAHVRETGARRGMRHGTRTHSSSGWSRPGHRKARFPRAGTRPSTPSRAARRARARERATRPARIASRSPAALTQHHRRHDHDVRIAYVGDPAMRLRGEAAGEPHGPRSRAHDLHAKRRRCRNRLIEAGEHLECVQHVVEPVQGRDRTLGNSDQAHPERRHGVRGTWHERTDIDTPRSQQRTAPRAIYRT